MAKRKVLNVRTHLEHIRLVLDGLKKYGMCPLIESELRKIQLMNNAILADHDKRRENGDRHDIR